MAQQVWAGGLLIGFLVLILLGLRIIRWSRKRAKVPDNASNDVRPVIAWAKLSALVGLDNRVSTSKTIALLWTMVVGYCLLALVLIATAKHSSAKVLPPGRIPDNFISTALKPLAPAYVVLLGSAFAAALAARAIVGGRTGNGSLQKVPSTTRPTPLDIVTDDDGNVDLVDLQFTLFNLIAATFVLTQFIPHPYALPSIPGALATLIGVSASVYTGNKGVTTNPASLTDVLTPSVPAGDPATVVGKNLFVGGGVNDAANAATTAVTLIPVDDSASADSSVLAASVPAQPIKADAGSVQFTVPAATEPGRYNVRVRTNAGGTAILRNQLTVLAARQPIGVQRKQP